MTDKEFRALNTIEDVILGITSPFTNDKDKIRAARQALEAMVNAGANYNQLLDNIIIYQGTKEPV